MSLRGKRRIGRGAIVGALVALWIAVLVLGFVAQTTELFGVRRGAFAFLLLGVAALGFVLIGSVGVWLTLGGVDEHSASTHARGDAAKVPGRGATPRDPATGPSRRR
jgi:hypothetical protein